MGKKNNRQKKWDKNRTEISIFFDDGEELRYDEEIGCKRFDEVLDLKDLRNETLDILYKLDDSVEIKISGISIRCPKRMVHIREEQ